MCLVPIRSDSSGQAPAHAPNEPNRAASGREWNPGAERSQPGANPENGSPSRGGRRPVLKEGQGLEDRSGVAGRKPPRVEGSRCQFLGTEGSPGRRLIVKPGPRAERAGRRPKLVEKGERGGGRHARTDVDSSANRRAGRRALWSGACAPDGPGRHANGARPKPCRALGGEPPWPSALNLSRSGGPAGPVGREDWDWGRPRGERRG
jgi:hypothetical protein